MKLEAEIQTGYGLRENPKKTKKLADSRADDHTSMCDKFCKECGKGFKSWKALFGHMKCHSEKEKVSSSLEEQDSWITGNQKLVKDSQSDNETTTAPNRRRRSKRRTNSTFSVAEIEQEQEEVALCLMMLSRHVGHWGVFNSAAESSDNASEFLQAPSTEVYVDGFLKNGSTEDSEFELAKNLNKNTELDQIESSSSKRKFEKICKISNNSRKFECAICNRIFHTYQALGGHRASHRNKGCLPLKTEINSENSIEIEFPTEPTADFKLIKSSRNEKQRAEKQKNKGHECPICLKVFSSGQALGGHKRSHLIQKPVSEIGELLDLNLPAPAEEENNDQVGFEPWWAGCSHN